MQGNLLVQILDKDSDLVNCFRIVADELLKGVIFRQNTNF